MRSSHPWRGSGILSPVAKHPGRVAGETLTLSQRPQWKQRRNAGHEEGSLCSGGRAAKVRRYTELVGTTRKTREASASRY